MNIKLIVSGLILCIGGGSCTKSHAPSKASELGVRETKMIMTQGEFLSPSREYLLRVTKDRRGTIAYEIQRVADGRIVVQDLDAFSRRSNWWFYWETDSALWAYSSDVGTALWRSEGSDWFILEGMDARALAPKDIADLFD